ncbi:hypothetical protein L3Q82_019843 [Scortum barcoo]|uniref:Uncharacterized protein n=1 Tax=Scortum barcoo TaxID=214431 RepID=A0ACB8VD65_9TELE|nr:hypothetical protein L3Q82_019843 [Scortum barcoo]
MDGQTSPHLLCLSKLRAQPHEVLGADEAVRVVVTRVEHLFEFPHEGRLSASTTSSPILPAPELNIHLRSEDSVVLVCRAPEGQRGVLFMLYRYRGKVDSQEQQSGTEEVHFTVPVKGEYSVQSELFCCVYKNQNGRYSAFSPYLKVERQNDAAPTRLIPSFPPPVLSVEPPSGVVKRGDMLSFTCSGPPPVPQSSSNRKPVTFLLLRTAEPTGLTYIIHQPPASQVSSSEPQPGVFSVGPVTGGEEGDYTCLYQITKKRGLVNSTVSNPVKITVTDALPMPTLVLQQQTDVWHLLCSGSPAYPGAVFYLHLADDELPVATHHATLVQHQATFLVPVQDTPVALYHCKYSVLLGKEWSYSERSLPLAVSKGTDLQLSSHSNIISVLSTDLPGVDLPLILGSISAVVLFLCSAALVAVVAYRKVKAVAREKKKRPYTPASKLPLSGFFRVFSPPPITFLAPNPPDPLCSLNP